MFNKTPEIQSSFLKFHNIIHFFATPSHLDQEKFSYVTALEDSGYLHLYLFKVSLQPQDLELVSDGIILNSINKKITECFR